MKNILDSAPKRRKKELKNRIRPVFDAPDEETARELAGDVFDRFGITAPKAVSKLEERLDDAPAVMALPEKYRKRLRTTNSIERLNQEIRRRERAIRIFPNQASAFGFIGALLVEQDVAWTEGREYFDMEEYWDWMESKTSSEDVPDPVPEKAHESHTDSDLTRRFHLVNAQHQRRRLAPSASCCYRAVLLNHCSTDTRL
ncbi:MAG: hypothetical protein AVO35_04725 [Candidatus Aegiribacteria sp. MLS_C]|nr:MAG: hypothetical protein AVO35_04725 [Candidatus Aegiribacteria sp. MLS_C]